MHHFLRIFCTFFTFCLSGIIILPAFAQIPGEIPRFIEKVSVVTYDCPDSELMSELEYWLSSSDINDAQRFELMLIKTHWQICMGRQSDALANLEETLSDSRISTESRAYAYGQYQIGFIHDVREDPIRCEYYQKALDLSANKFDDIALSAELGLITVCPLALDENVQKVGELDGIKLGRLYAILEKYGNKGDEGAVAHIHNNIGLLYAGMGQHALAAEQYLKTYQMGLGEYNSSNLLATLISVITAQMASGDFEGARHTIDEFRTVNTEVNTPQTNVWLHFSEAGLFYRTGQFAELEQSLAKWRVFLDDINNPTYSGLFRWYSAALCLDKSDLPCLEQFLNDEQQASDAYKAFVRRNKDYLKLQVDINFALGRHEEAQQAFDDFARLMLVKNAEQQKTSKVLGIANLHSQVLSLESTLQTEEQRRDLIVGTAVAAGITMLIAGWILFRRYQIRSEAIDPSTGFLNTRAVLNKIKHTDRPEPNRVNAIALFEVSSLRSIPSRYGHMAGDLALRQIASALKLESRKGDIIGRLGAEQFIVCIEGVEEVQARRYFARIMEALQSEQLRLENGNAFELKPRMSIYIASDSIGDIEDVLNDMEKGLNVAVTV